MSGKPNSDEYTRIDVAGGSADEPSGLAGGGEGDSSQAAISGVSGVAHVELQSPPNPNAAAESAPTGAAADAASAAAANTTTGGAAAPATGVMRVNVRTLTGQQIECDLPAGAPNTVADIKAKVEEVQGVPPAFQRLIFSGRELNDPQLLSEIGIQHTNVVHLVLRQNAPLPPPAGGGGVPAVIAAPEGGGGGGGGMGGIAWDPARILAAQQLGRIVKLFAVVDGMFLLVWSISYTPLLAAAALCAAGFYGATKYRLPYVLLYVLYLLGAIAFRIYWATTAWNDSRSLVLLLILMVILEIYILSIVYRFTKLIRQLTPADRNELLPHEPEPIVIAGQRV